MILPGFQGTADTTCLETVGAIAELCREKPAQYGAVTWTSELSRPIGDRDKLSIQYCKITKR